MKTTLLRLPQDLLFNRDLTRTSFRVLFHLISLADETQEVTTAQMDVSEILSESLRKVQHSFIQLQKVGYIDWENRGSRTSTKIRLLWNTVSAPKFRANPNSQSSSQPKIQSKLNPRSSLLPTPRRSLEEPLDLALQSPSLARPRGTARAVPPLPNILARLSVLEEQHDSRTDSLGEQLQRLTEAFLAQQNNLSQELNALRSFVQGDSDLSTEISSVQPPPAAPEPSPFTIDSIEYPAFKPLSQEAPSIGIPTLAIPALQPSTSQEVLQGNIPTLAIPVLQVIQMGKESPPTLPNEASGEQAVAKISPPNTTSQGTETEGTKTTEGTIEETTEGAKASPKTPPSQTTLHAIPWSEDDFPDDE